MTGGSRGVQVRHAPHGPAPAGSAAWPSALRSRACACVCPPGALLQNLLEELRQREVDVEALSPRDLDEAARVLADALRDPWRGAGAPPTEPAHRPEAALLEDGDAGRDGLRGEPRVLVDGEGRAAGRGDQLPGLWRVLATGTRDEPGGFRLGLPPGAQPAER